MNVVKKLALGILSPLFILLLFATAFDIGFVRTATHPTTVKKLVAESGIYNSVVPNLLQQSKSIDTSLGTFSASDPAIQKAANEALSPQFVKQNTEQTIDSIYKWLDGTTAQPDFMIDLSGAKTSFADNVAAVIEQRLGSLPVCTTAQTIAYSQNGQFDAVNAVCLPRGTTGAGAAAQVKDSLVGGKGLIDKSTLSAESLKNSNNKPVFETSGLAQAPKQYQRAKKTPLILSILTILTGIGIVFLSSTWQKGLRHVGINLVVIGLIMLVLSYALNRAVSTKIAPQIKVDNAILQADLRNLVTNLVQQVDKNYWFFGGLYTVLGATAITTEMFLVRRAVATKPKPATASTKAKA